MIDVSADLTSATAQRIVKAAVACFFDYGYHATSMRQIAAQARIQPASVYHWFPSKESLLVSVMERFLENLSDAAEAARLRHEAPQQQLEAVVYVHVMHHGRYRQEALVSDIEIRALSRSDRSRIVKSRDAYQQMVRGIVERGIADGSFVCEDAGVATNAILVQCTGVASWYRPRGRLTLDDVARIHAELVCASLRPCCHTGEEPSQDEEVRPVNERRVEQSSDLPEGLAAPARRALAVAGLTRLDLIAQVTEPDVRQLHGIGPNALRQLREALANAGLSFADK